MNEYLDYAKQQINLGDSQTAAALAEIIQAEAMLRIAAALEKLVACVSVYEGDSRLKVDNN